MNRTLAAVIAVIGATLLQAGLAPYLTIGGVTPNFLLLVVITLALTNGSMSGATVGFIAGLIFDLLGTGPVGPMALVLSVTGYLVGSLNAHMFAEGWLLPLSVLGIGALAAEIAHGLILGLVGAGGPFWLGLLTIMLPSAAYNTVLALLVYPWLARFLRRGGPVKSFQRLG